jgi:heme-degrading monooxygenase HmoA
MKSDVYTLGVWRVKPGQQERFVATWREVGDFFNGLPNPPSDKGILVQSLQDENQFYSFGPWRSLEDIQAMRANPQTGEVLGRLAALCDEAKPGSYRVVARSPEA